MWEWLGDIWESIKGIPQAIIDLLGNLLQWLFVPEESYFENEVNKIKEKISEKIPYQDYINLFETVKTVSAGEDLSIDLPEYKVSDNLIIKQHKFIDFAKVTKYKNTWYGWVRGFTFIFMIIYNINQIMKFLRGFNVTDGANALGISQSNSSSGGK